jgi:hypothetical protein
MQSVTGLESYSLRFSHCYEVPLQTIDRQKDSALDSLVGIPSPITPEGLHLKVIERVALRHPIAKTTREPWIGIEQFRLFRDR